MSRLRAAWSRVEPSVDTRRGTLVVGLFALVAHSLLTLVFPVIEGRDYVTYLRVYAEMWSWTSVIPWEMLWRMPVAPALLGVPLDLLGPWGARVAIALGFAATVTLWFRVATRFGPRTAAATAAVLVASPSFGLLFHRYSSERSPASSSPRSVSPRPAPGSVHHRAIRGARCGDHGDGPYAARAPGRARARALAAAPAGRPAPSGSGGSGRARCARSRPSWCGSG